MTNGEYVKNNLTAEIVAAVISKLLEHSNDYCDVCPVHEDCNSIHEKISKSVPEEKITCEDIIVHWWNTGIDSVYFVRKSRCSVILTTLRANNHLNF